MFLLEEALRENMLSYAKHTYEENIYHTQKEIALARYALTKQAEAFHELINSPETKKFINEHPVVGSQLLEQRSRALIESSTLVSRLVQSAVNTDINKAEIHALLSSLPDIISTEIKHIGGTESAAAAALQRITLRISDLRDKLKYENTQYTQQAGITYEEYGELLQSVPTQP